MRTPRTPRSALGLMVSAAFTLGTVGCQPETSMPETPSSPPSLGAAAPAPTPAADPSTEALPPLEMIRSAAVQAEGTVDRSIRRTARAVEHDAETLQPIAPAPAHTHTHTQPMAPVVGAARQGVHAAVGAVGDGVQQISGQVQGAVRQTADQVRQGVHQKADDLKQQIQQSADELEQKAVTHTRRATDAFLQKVEQEGKDTLKQGTERIKEQFRQDAAPKR